MVPSHAMAEFKQTAQAKILMSQILIQKRAHQIVNKAYHKIAHFFMSQNDHHLGDAINFDHVSYQSDIHISPYQSDWTEKRGCH